MLKKFCQCLGIASLILVGNYGDLLGGGADVRMHTPYPLTQICIAQIADILLVAVMLFAISAVFVSTRFYPWVRLLLLIVIPPYLLQRAHSLFSFDLMKGALTVILVVWAAFLLVLLLRFPKWYRRLLQFGGALAAALAIFAVSSIAQLIWVATWKPAPNQIAAAWDPTDKTDFAARSHPLLVWIVFDELSYDQVFEHRAHSLTLPHFDSLRAQSTVFTDTRPVGYFTVKVIPSLLTGNTVEGIRYNFHNRLSVHYDSGHGWTPITGEQTVFGDATKAGWRTAVVGWYNPYCSAYADALQNCYWSNRDTFDGYMAPNTPLWTNIYAPLQQVVREIKSPARANRDICTFDVRHRYKTETDLQQRAFQLLRTDQADFVFLHFAIPHSPNIWSRIREDYTQQCNSSYLDNLALVDRVLGRLVSILQSSPRWGRTTLIVEGDHGWRVNAWNSRPAWTNEDGVASRGVFDDRPALLIHRPGQNRTESVSSPWPIIQIHRVVEQILQYQPITF